MHKHLQGIALVALFTVLPLSACTDNGENGTMSSSAPTATLTSKASASSSSTPSQPTQSETTPADPPTKSSEQTAVTQTQPQSVGIIGYTGAPGVDHPHLLNKTISSCGNPNLYQTGTTFFTDGTSGWTQHCATQIASQSNHYQAPPQRMATPSTPTFNPDSGDGYGPNQTLPPLCERIPDAEQCQ